MSCSIQSHGDERICNGGVGRIEERSSAQPELLLEALLIIVVCAASGDHVWVHSPAAVQQETVLMSVAHVTTKGHVDFHNLSCQWRPCQGPVSCCQGPY